MKRVLPFALTAVIAVLLVACSQGAPTDNRPGATVTEMSNLGPAGFSVLAAGLVLVDGDFAPSITTTAVTHINNGYYIGSVTAFDWPDAFKVIFPTAAELPNETMSPATSFVRVLGNMCTTTSSNPSARVTELTWAQFPIPAIGGIGPLGTALGITSDQTLNPAMTEAELAAIPKVSWVYATGPTVVATPTSGCVIGTLTTPGYVDLDLQRGWNQVEFRLNADPANPTTIESISLVNSTIEDLNVSFVPAPVMD